MSHHQALLYDLTRHLILNLEITEQDANSTINFYIYIYIIMYKNPLCYVYA